MLNLKRNLRVCYGKGKAVSGDHISAMQLRWKGFEMQQESYENQPLVWQEVPIGRFSRQTAHYRARSGSEWHDRLEQRSFSARAGRSSHSARRAFRQKDPLTRLLPALLIALALVFVVAAALGALSGSANASDDPEILPAQEKAIKSTAREQWMRGKMPYLYQIDSEWSSIAYAGGTIGDSACGPTCMSMVYIYLTGKKDKDPRQMAAFSEANGYIENGMTRWAFMTEGASKLGLTSRELPADESIIRAQLEAGHPIIVSVTAGDFTTKGHFIVLESVDAFGRILIRDPNNPEYSGQAWDLSRILSQTRNLWAISV